MSDIEKLLAEFAAAWDAGARPEPEDFLSRAESTADRSELGRELELFLEIAPTPGYDDPQLDQLRSSGEAGAAAAAFQAVAGARAISGARASSGLTLRELAKRLLSLARIDPDPVHVARAEAHLTDLEAGATSLQSWTRAARDAIAQILDLDLAPRAPAGALLRSSGADRDLLEQIDFVADALDSSSARASESDDPVDRFIRGAGGDAS